MATPGRDGVAAVIIVHLHFTPLLFSFSSFRAMGYTPPATARKEPKWRAKFNTETPTRFEKGASLSPPSGCTTRFGSEDNHGRCEDSHEAPLGGKDPAHPSHFSFSFGDNSSKGFRWMWSPIPRRLSHQIRSRFLRQSQDPSPPFLWFFIPAWQWKRTWKAGIVAILVPHAYDPYPRGGRRGRRSPRTPADVRLEVRTSPLARSMPRYHRGWRLGSSGSVEISSGQCKPVAAVLTFAAGGTPLVSHFFGTSSKGWSWDRQPQYDIRCGTRLCTHWCWGRGARGAFAAVQS